MSSVFSSLIQALAGFKLPTGAGSGKVLTSDADGDGTWQDPPGAGGVPVYVGPDAPPDPPAKYFWIQTEYGGPNGFTLWFQDGEA